MAKCRTFSLGNLGGMMPLMCLRSMNIVLILITRSLGEGHDAEAILKKNWWIRCEASRQEDRKLDRTAF